MKLVIATKNKGKLAEFERLLSPLGYEVLSQADCGIQGQAEENGNSFQENAQLKAEYVFQRTGCTTLADDSGLCVDALDGRPGIFSARYGGPGLTDSDRVQLLLNELADVPEEKRTAYFACAICLIYPDGEKDIVFETCEGTIGREPVGENGFGYDPAFMVDGKSFSQINGTDKDCISHRGKALRRVFELLKEKKEGYDHK